MNSELLCSGCVTNGTFGVLGLRGARSCQVKVRFVILTQQDDAAQAICGEYPRHPAWRHRGLGLVIFAQACEHGVIVHLVLFL